MMKWASYLLLSIICIFFSSCASRKPSDETTLVSIQVIDRNGFSETISTKDRIARYQNTDFCDPQPYQKVLRVFGKDKEGKNASIITSYHNNGHLWQYLEVSNGRAHGLYKEWHFNGNQKMNLHVIEGIPELSETALKSWVFDGINQIFDENGSLLAEISYERGMLQGDSLYYYSNGQVKRRVPYLQDELHGALLCYHENGSIAETIPHIKGLRQGSASSFFPDGRISYEEVFDKGLLISGKYLKEDGSLISSIEEGFGKRSEWESGILKRMVTYQKGIAEGLIECFDEKGFLQITFHQKEGKKHGEELEYYSKESQDAPLRPKILLNWQEDVLQGIVKTWHSNGKQESQKEMYQNKKNGMSLAWYKNGDLMLSEEYEKDLITSGFYYKKGDRKPISKIVAGKGIATLYHPEGYLLQKVCYEKGAPSIENDIR